MKTLYSVCSIIFDQNNTPEDLKIIRCNDSFSKFFDISDKKDGKVLFSHLIVRDFETGEDERPFSLFLEKVLANEQDAWILKHLAMNCFYQIQGDLLGDSEVIIKITEFEKSMPYPRMISNSFDIINIIGVDGTLLYENEAAVKLLGYPNGERIGKNTFDLVHPEDRERVYQEFKELVEKGVEKKFIQFRFQHQDGSWCWFESYGRNLMDDPDFHGILINSREITERKKIEKMYQVKERYLEAIRKVSECFLQDLQDFPYQYFIEQIGQAASADRAYVFLNDIRDDVLYTSITAEYCVDGIESQINNPNIIDSVFFEDMPRWQKLLSQGQFVYGPVSEFPDSEKEILEPQGILSLIILPFFVNDFFAGFIGLDSCREKKEWTDTEQGFLKTAVAALEHALETFQTRRMLKTSEEKFRILLQYSHFGVAIGNSYGLIIEVNEQFCKMTGYRKNEILGKHFKELTYPADFPKEHKYIQEMIRGEQQSYRLQKRYVCKDGEIIWVDVVISALRDANHEVKEFIGMILDITPQRKLIQDARESNERLHALYDGTFGGIIIHDQGRIIECNQALSSITGYTREELIGMDGLLLILEEERPKVRQKIIEQYEKPYESRGVRKNGEIYPLRIHGKKIHYQGKLVRNTEFIDITERKEAEKEIMRHQNMLQGIINMLPGTLNVIDRDFRLSVVNDSGVKLKITDFHSFEELKGQVCYRVFMKRDSPCPWCKVKEVFTTGQPYQEWTTPDDPREKKTGRALQIFVAPIRNQDGEITHVIEYGIDVTELRLSRQRAEEASRAKSVFLANMSHEIRTPMNGIAGFSQLLMNSKLSAEQRQYVKNISSSAEALLEIINEILDISKVESGKVIVEEKMTGLMEIIRHVSGIVRFKAIEKELDFIVDVAENVPDKIQIDSLKLKQILINLLGNSVKFTESGMVELKVRFEEKSRERRIGRIVFSVIDTGIGIPEESKIKLFEAFEQGEYEVSSRFGGTGLGLSIARALTEKMDGRLTLDSVVGEGTAFQLIFDKEYEKSENRKENREFSRIEKVLIIDHCRKAAEVVQRMFESRGIQSRICVSLSDADDLIVEKGKGFSVVMISSRFPEKMISGFIKESGAQFDLILLMGDSLNEMNLQETYFNESKFAVVSKPVLKDDLFDLIYRWLNSLNIHDDGESGKNLVSAGGRRLSTVLLAEDQEINRDLMRIVLKEMFPNISLIEAENGEEAVCQYRRQQFDLILMDVRMPVMDGIKAVREIREAEKNTGKHIPVVALTAGVMDSERQRCYDNGMDAVLTKPLQFKALKDILRQLFFSDSMDGVDLQTVSGPEEHELKIGKLMQQVNGNAEGVKRLMQTVLEGMPAHIWKLREAFQNGNWDDLRKTAHTVKGIALNLLFSRIADTAQKLEKIEEGARSETDLLIRQMKTDWETLSGEIEEYLDKSKKD